MIYEEKTVSSEKVFEGRIIKVKVDKVEMPDGSTSTRELVEHPGGVGIVAVTDNDEIILVKQYRKPLDKVIYEIPAGKLEPGLSAKVFDYMGFIYPSPGFTDEVTHVYLAKELTQGETHPDDDEFLDVEKVPFERALKMVIDGEINDAKSVFGILKYNMMR